MSIIHLGWLVTELMVLVGMVASCRSRLQYVELYFDAGVTSLVDLASQKELLYGTVHGSVTDVFFSEQDQEPFPQMYTVMKKFNTWVSSATEGFARVRNASGRRFIFRMVMMMMTTTTTTTTTTAMMMMMMMI